MEKDKRTGPITKSENSGPSRYYEHPLTDEKIKKLIPFLRSGWKLPTAMSQCSISLSNRNAVIKKLDELGIKDYKK